MANFIAIEGLEGAGKSTAVNTIKSYMASKNINALYTREPGGTFLAEKIRSLLITPYQEESLCDDAEMLLMYASRMQHVNQFIKPAINQGRVVVSDRFNWSSLAYQGGGRKLSFEKVKQLNDLLLGDFSPSLTIYLDIDPEIGLQRARSRNALDRIEQEKIDFFNRARDIFLTLVDNDKNAFSIDASESVEHVSQLINDILNKYCFT